MSGQGWKGDEAEHGVDAGGICRRGNSAQLPDVPGGPGGAGPGRGRGGRGVPGGFAGVAVAGPAAGQERGAALAGEDRGQLRLCPAAQAGPAGLFGRPAGGARRPGSAPAGWVVGGGVRPAGGTAGGGDAVLL